MDPKCHSWTWLYGGVGSFMTIDDLSLRFTSADCVTVLHHCQILS